MQLHREVPPRTRQVPSVDSPLLTHGQLLKRCFDLVVSSAVLLCIGWLIPIVATIARFNTGSSGIFPQERIGRHGERFTMLKIRTMREDAGVRTSITTAHDPRITSFGAFLRRTKLDELPQVINVFLGTMSLVGPRPDVPGWADQLEGDDRVVLEVRPGITGPATLVFRDEEAILAAQEDPERYNREVLWPAKVRLNCRYIQHWRFRDDIRYLVMTFRGGNMAVEDALP